MFVWILLYQVITRYILPWVILHFHDCSSFLFQQFLATLASIMEHFPWKDIVPLVTVSNDEWAWWNTVFESPVIFLTQSYAKRIPEFLVTL